MKSQSNSQCEVENCPHHTQEPPQKGAASTTIISNSQERSRAKNAQVNSQELDKTLEAYAHFVSAGVLEWAGREANNKKLSKLTKAEAKAKLLQLALSCLAEKYHFVQYREFLVADKKMTIEHNQKQAQSYVQGFNAAIDTMEQNIRLRFQ